MKKSGKVHNIAKWESEDRILHDEEGMIDVVIACTNNVARMIDSDCFFVRLNKLHATSIGNMIRRAIEEV